MSKVKIRHGTGPVTALVGRGVIATVELTPAVQEAIDAGIIVLVTPPPKVRKPKAEKPVVGTIASTEGE